MSRDLAIFIGCTEVAQKGKWKSQWTYSLPAQHDHTGYTGRLPHLQRGDQEACRSLGRKATNLVDILKLRSRKTPAIERTNLVSKSSHIC
jgi:hypothetical protein